MSEMIDWTKKRAEDAYHKFRSPLYFTFLFAVLAWHWEIVIYFIRSTDVAGVMIGKLASGVYPVRWWQPFVTTAALHLFYPMLQVASDRWASTISTAVAIVVDNWDIRLRAIKSARENAATLAANLNSEVIRLQQEVERSKKEQKNLQQTQSRINQTNAALVKEIAEMQDQTTQLSEKKETLVGEEIHTPDRLHQYKVYFETGVPEENYRTACELLRVNFGESYDYETSLEEKVGKLGDSGIVKISIHAAENSQYISEKLHDLFGTLRIDHIT